MKVIVVGAGTAGLLVTRELIARGYEVVTLEKNSTPGGRISGAERDSYRDVRGLYLCGEYMRMPGTVESAFRSGLATVDALSGDYSS